MKKYSIIIFIVLAVFFTAQAYAEMITLRPNATIVDADTKRGCTSGWDCLDEVAHDSTATAAAITSSSTFAQFDFNDTKDYISGGLPSGAIIDWVLATGVLRDATGSNGANNGFLRLHVPSGSARSVYNTSDLNPIGAWKEFNHTNYTTNPKSGAAWTLDDLDGLMLGFDASGDANPPVNATQLSIKVGYTPVLTGNASFNGNGASASIDLGQNNVFNGTCNVNGGMSNVGLYVQDNSSGSWANTSGDTSADIYTNRTVYNISSLSGTSDSMRFSITAQNTAAIYSLRIQCNGPNAVPAEANSTASTLTVNGAADTCTPTIDNNWVLNCADNCKINNKEYFVRRINVSGSGTIYFAKSNVTYTAFRIPAGCKFVFNETFKFKMGQIH